MSSEHWVGSTDQMRLLVTRIAVQTDELVMTAEAARSVKLSTSIGMAIGAPGSLVGTIAQRALSPSKWLAHDLLPDA